MSRQHGKYSEEQLAAAVGAKAPDAEAGRDLFLREIDSTDSSTGAETTLSGEAQERGPEGKAPTPEPVPIKTDATARKFKAELNKVKDQISAAIPDAINIKLKDSPEWQLSADESEAVAESIQNCLKVLDIELAVQPLQWTFTSPFWVIIMPLLTLLIIFGKKAAKNAPEKEKENDKSDKS